MTSRGKSWIARLPKPAAPDVQHRFSIAGRTVTKVPIEPASAAADLGMVSQRLRDRMVERIRSRGIDDRVVLDAMRAVPRHAFVDAALASRAYEDTALPIGHEQTISQPYIVARMLALMRDGRALKRVLEVGTGCGYQAAVIGQFVPYVVSIERIRALHAFARTHLHPLRLSSVRLHYGDGRDGYAPDAPYDGIVVAAAGMAIPETLLRQLSIGGRLVAPVAHAGDAVQRLVIVERSGDMRWERRELDDVHFVPLKQGTT